MTHMRLGDGSRIKTGMLVFNINDPRHVGRITSFYEGRADIVWCETGWKSTEWLSDLQTAKEE